MYTRKRLQSYKKILKQQAENVCILQKTFREARDLLKKNKVLVSEGCEECLFHIKCVPLQRNYVRGRLRAPRIVCVHTD